MKAVGLPSSASTLCMPLDEGSVGQLRYIRVRLCPSVPADVHHVEGRCRGENATPDATCRQRYWGAAASTPSRCEYVCCMSLLSTSPVTCLQPSTPSPLPGPSSFSLSNRPSDKTRPLIGSCPSVSAERESSKSVNRQKLCEHEVPCPSEDATRSGSANQGNHVTRTC